MALWFNSLIHEDITDGLWLPATIASIHDGGDYYCVDWNDNDESGKFVAAENVRAASHPLSAGL